MATDTRTSELGNVFPVATVREFLLRALGHDAVIDQVNELLFDHVVGHKYHPSVVAASLKPLLDEVLDVATSEDWDWVARALTAEACEALGVDHPLDHVPKKARALRSLDAGELRGKLADIYTQKSVSLSRALRALWVVRRLSQLTGISREQIQADAKADAEAMRAAEDGTTAGAGQSSAHMSARAEASDVTVDLPETFVRTLSREEALTLMQQGEESENPVTRRRAAILIASNVGCTTSQIAAMHGSGVPRVRSVIADFNARGMESLDSPQ